MLHLKILFFHNTLPEYRIGWFQHLTRKSDVKFVFTNEGLNKKNYGFDIDYKNTNNLDCTFLPGGINGFIKLKEIMKNIQQYDFVELPPIDSLREVIFSAYIVNHCKKNDINVGFFWEKWEAPIEMQPFVRRLKNLVLRVIPKLIYKHADIIFSAGQKSKEYFISNGIDENTIVIIPDASETPKCNFVDIRSKYGIEQGKKIIMYLGRILPQKGVKLLIKAFNLLPASVQEKSHLLIVGDGEDLANCIKLAEQLDIKNITFTGSVEPLKRGNYFEQCDVFVYPVTYYKGRVDVWGLAINEAIQHGKVIIATHAVGSAYELIEDNKNGYRIEPGNVQKLSMALVKSLAPQISKSAIQKNKELISRFSYKEMAEQYIKIILAVTKKSATDTQ